MSTAIIMSTVSTGEWNANASPHVTMQLISRTHLKTIQEFSAFRDNKRGGITDHKSRQNVVLSC
jgi:hypothetical protein